MCVHIPPKGKILHQTVSFLLIGSWLMSIYLFIYLLMYELICHLFSTSLQNNPIPQEWHTHCVIPIYKAGDKSSVCNYRPISLLCILSKVLERIVYNNIIRHIQGKITEHQFGFLPNRSTLQQLLLFTEKLLEAKTEVDVVYMDFRSLSQYPTMAFSTSFTPSE